MARGSAPDERARPVYQSHETGVSNAAASRIVGVNRTTGHRWRYGRSITIRAGEIRTYPAITRPAHRVSARFLSEAERIGDPQTIWIIAAKLAFDEGRQRWRWGPSELRAPGHAGDPGSVHEQLDRTATDDE